MDFATIIGLVLGFGLMVWSIVMGTSLMSFVDVSSVLIVAGGSVSAALISFPLKELAKMPSVMKNAFMARTADPCMVIKEMVAFAEIARRDGILSLESATQGVKDPFILSGIQMAVDGTDPELMEQILSSEMDAIDQRHSNGKALVDCFAKYGPAFGMIGTLIGLVIMLRNMSDPSSIGPAMAVALMTTFYGAIIANLMTIPIADKLALRNQEEMLIKSIIVRGVMAIQSGDNPRVVEQKLATFLPPRMRKMTEAEAA